MRMTVRLKLNTTSPTIPTLITRTPIRIMVLASLASEGRTPGSLPAFLTREAAPSMVDAHSMVGDRSVAGTPRVIVRPQSVARLQSLATGLPQIVCSLVTFLPFDTSNLVEDHAAVNQWREVKTMKKLTVALVAMLILALSASAYAGISVGFGVQIAPEPSPVPPPAYAYPSPYPYPYPVPAPYYYPAPRYYGPRAYTVPPPVLFDFGIRFGDRGHSRHFEHRWH